MNQKSLPNWFGRPAGWLAGWLASWLASWLAGWLAGFGGWRGGGGRRWGGVAEKHLVLLILCDPSKQVGKGRGNGGRKTESYKENYDPPYLEQL